MARIAVIQDGTELARQTDADITGCFERCCELLSADGPRFVAHTFTDEGVGPLLQGVQPDDYACLVVASNALASGQIEEAVRRYGDSLRNYVDAGGGLVVLHQLSDDLSVLLPEPLRPQLQDRRAPRAREAARALDGDDVLLNFPCTVDLAPFVDGGFGIGPPALFYKSLHKDLPAALKPVLGYRDELLAVRTYEHLPQRVVVTTLPLDWQRALGLLSNAIRFAAVGTPRRLVWRDAAAPRRRLLLRWLTTDGGASIRTAPDPGEDIPPPDRWLLGHVDVMVVAPGRFTSVRERPEVAQFLDRGGAVVSADDTSRPASEITALVGAYTERTLAAKLYGELRATSGWRTEAHAFELRNIVASVHYLWSDQANRTPGSVTLAELAGLRAAVVRRLRTPEDREDLSSSLAHGQTLAFLSDRPVDADLVDWMLDDPRGSRFDVALQIRAVRALALCSPDPAWARDAAPLVTGTEVPVPGLVRVLDAAAALDQAGLYQSPPADTAALTDGCCTVLEGLDAEPGVGWLSIEATADASRGLNALLRNLPPQERELAGRVADLIGTATSVLRPALRRYQPNAKGVAWLARLVHAIALTDRQFPIGLLRLSSLPWPEAAGSTAGGVDTSLLDRLAAENKAVRARVEELETERLAAKVGRGAATVAVVLPVAAALVALLVLVGLDSIWDLLGNVAILTGGSLGLVAGLFTLLDRAQLLARPAQRVLAWITKVVPLVETVGKLRRRSP